MPPRRLLRTRRHREIHHHRPSHHSLLRHESPIPAVFAVVPVVAHHKILSRRNPQIAIPHVPPHHHPPRRVDVRIHVVQRREIISKAVRDRRSIERIRLIDRLAIHEQLSIPQMQMVPRKPDHTLDEIHLWVERVMKDRDVSPPQRGPRQQRVQRPVRSQCLLVHQQKIAHSHGRVHRLRRNLKRLQNKSNDKRRDHHHQQKRLNGSQHIVPSEIALARSAAQSMSFCSGLTSSAQFSNANAAARCCASFFVAPSADASVRVPFWLSSCASTQNSLWCAGPLCPASTYRNLPAPVACTRSCNSVLWSRSAPPVEPASAFRNSSLCGATTARSISALAAFSPPSR